MKILYSICIYILVFIPGIGFASPYFKGEQAKPGIHVSPPSSETAKDFPKDNGPEIGSGGGGKKHKPATRSGGKKRKKTVSH